MEEQNTDSKQQEQETPARGPGRPPKVVKEKEKVVEESGFSTFSGDEANRYIQAGGRLVAITKRYPKNPFKPGKKYTFLETKKELDKILADADL